MSEPKDIQSLTSNLLRSKPLKKLLKQYDTFRSKGTKLHLHNIQGSMPAVAIHGLSMESASPILCIAKDEDGAGYLYNDLASIRGDVSDGNLFFFPSSYKRGIKYGSKDTANEVLRTQTTDAISKNTLDAHIVIVTYPEAILEKVVASTEEENKNITIKLGDTIDRAKLRKELWDLGFSETDYVYEPGQFAVRGSLIDIFSYSYEEPIRIDFFGDEVDSIRTFDCVDQCSIEKKEHATITPPTRDADLVKGKNFLELIQQDITLYVENIPLTSSTFETIFNSSPVHTDSNPIKDQEHLQAHLTEPQKMLELLMEQSLVMSPFIGVNNKQWKEIDFSQQPEPLYHKQFDKLIEDIKKFTHEMNYDVYIMSGQKSQLERLTDIFDDKGKDVNFIPVMPTLHSGFIDHSIGVVVLTDHSIFERFHRYRTKVERIRQNIASLTLKEIQGFEFGDYVVHTNHGIGQFAGLLTMEQNGKSQEYVRINYQGGDSIYVSIHALHHISKYRSKDNETPPRLSKLGTGAWDRLKERTKKKVKDIARDLIKLYAARMEQKGFAFSPDSYLQHELESSFMYEDTPDQEKTTEEVKQDMEQPIPMDRLVCGDVGFGKTEIAIRAAFKAATDGKQVAVLVPTTVLAYQHYKTFSKRLKDFPVDINYLSRAKTAKEERAILEDLKTGKVDIIIGTHKLVSKKVEFKDLGLLIIDEEQKFGVAVKEKLRQMRANIDTLTMTATPIPRTLQFSLMGARDLSNIQTPPPNRQPIRTELSTFNQEIISEAINYEMARGGQVFFVHNRIHNLNDIANAIKKAVPDARIGIGHGQMKPKDMEKVLLDFVNEKYDVLLSTAIVESGLDVPNANTMIINDAHRYGLSDLHQLRGRVGRSDKKAYCYLLIPPKDALTPEAVRRLNAITSFSELGSGIHIAMQDLDIRGAGNMLGAEQSGFIADLGYDTYRRVLEEAVEELRDEEFNAQLEKASSSTSNKKGEELKAKIEKRSYVKETTVDTDLEAFYPDSYIPGNQEKLLLYRELDEIQDEKALNAYTDKLLDRFGPLPEEANDLLEIIRIKWKAQKLGIERIILKNNQLKLQFVSDKDSPYYKTKTFSSILTNPILLQRKMQFKESSGKRYLNVPNVKTISEASSVLNDFLVPLS